MKKTKSKQQKLNKSIILPKNKHWYQVSIKWYTNLRKQNLHFEEKNKLNFHKQILLGNLFQSQTKFYYFWLNRF